MRAPAGALRQCIEQKRDLCACEGATGNDLPHVSHFLYCVVAFGKLDGDFWEVRIVVMC